MNIFKKYMDKFGFSRIEDIGAAFVVITILSGMAYEAVDKALIGIIWIVVASCAVIHYRNESEYHKNLYERAIHEWGEMDRELETLYNPPTNEEALAYLIERELSREQIDKIHRRIKSGFWVVPPEAK